MGRSPGNSDKLWKLIIALWVPCILAVAWITVIDVQDVQVQPLSSDEYLVKSAFLYNFAKFTEWPAQESADESIPINICILGVDPFDGALETIKGKTAQNRNLEIKHVARVEDLKACHILFISASERNHLPRILDALKDSPVLTVGDMKEFAQQGGIINLTTEQNKIGLEINVEAAERAGLKISSKLLKLAKIVRSKL